MATLRLNHSNLCLCHRSEVIREAIDKANGQLQKNQLFLCNHRAVCYLLNKKIGCTMTYHTAPPPSIPAQPQVKGMTVIG